MTNVLYEGLHPGSFILQEGDHAYSRDNVPLSGATILQPGQVLGQITATGKYVPLAPSASDGSQNAGALPVYRYDVTGSDVLGVAITRHAQVIADQLVWPVGISAQDKATAIAALKTKGILVR